MFQDPAEWMYAELMQTPTDVAATMLALVAATDLRPLLPQLDLPTLLINGKQSVVPYDQPLAGGASATRSASSSTRPGTALWDDPAGFNRAV
jgi:pimeloyl-ACP methyl ester carboxylesterase